MDVGLPAELQDEIRSTYTSAVEKHGKWTRADGTRAYAGSCASEYFAELSMWYFGTHGEFVDRERRVPAAGPGGLAEYDPEGFRLLASIFGGTNAQLSKPDPVRQRLQPAPNSAASEEREEQMVAMEFDNRGCDCSWDLFWVTHEGAKVKYGAVQSGSNYVQQTFPGHVWLLEAPAGGAGACVPRVPQLRYAASADACLAAVAADSGCDSS